MTPSRLRRIRGAQGRRGSAMVLVLLLTFALAALAGSAILLSSTATQTVKSRESEKDLRYAADAAIAIGESQIVTDPTTVPQTGYATLASMTPMLAADSTPISNIVYNLYSGQTGSATRQNGRFVTLVAQAMDTAHHRSFIRRVELRQETFAKFAYFSNSENGICFGSGDILFGPVFSNSLISTCGPPQVATFDDSVLTSTLAAAPGVINGNPGADVFADSFRTNVPAIPLPSTANLVNLFPLAAAGNTVFTSPNTITDSVSLLRSRLEFDAYNDSNPTFGADSTDTGEGFVKFYSIDETLTYWAQFAAGTKRDSAAGGYLRTGLNKRADSRNCGDWHFVADSIPGNPIHYSWQFFPAALHDSAGFQLAVMGAGVPVRPYARPNGWWDGNGTLHFFVKDSGAGPIYQAGLDSNFIMAYNSPATKHLWLRTGYVTEQAAITAENTAPGANTAHAVWLSVITPTKAPLSPAPACYPAGDPHLVAFERTGWKNTTGVAPALGQGYGWKGGTDTTYTIGTGGPGTTIPAGLGVGRWTVWPSTAITWKNAGFKARHADWSLLFPIDTSKNAGFKGVIAVHGSTGVSGNVDGHVTVYVDGNVGMVDNLRLTTDESDSNCNHGMGIVASKNITAMDNGINVPQHWAAANLNGTLDSNWVDLRASAFGGSLWVESTVMALGSWGAEGLTADSSYVSSVLCPAAPVTDDIFKRGCLYVFGSIIQNSRVTVNSGSGGLTGYGYAKRYQYDICAVSNPLPYFPTTGRLIENKYYEHDPNHFDVTALYNSLNGP